MVVFESSSRFLHFLHWIFAVVTLAACVHLWVRLFRRRDSVRSRLHARTLLIAYWGTYTIGAMIYPTFRVRVRAELLDRVHPVLSGLFEIKEHIATLMLLPVIAIFVLSRLGESTSRSTLLRGLVSLLLGALIYNACVGWYLGTLKAV
jgi:hypothetical protein